VKLTWLADEFRGVGLHVVEEPGWERRGKAWLRGRPIGAVQHHTAAPVPHNVRGLYEPKLIKCNFNVKPDGTVHVIAAGSCNFSTGEGSEVVRKETAKSIAPSDTAEARRLKNNAGGNSWYINNETDHLGDGGPIPKVQYEAVLNCWLVIFEEMGWPAERLIAHGEWTDRKRDPKWNDKNSHHNLEDLRADLRSALGGGRSRLQAVAIEEDIDTMLPFHFTDGFSEPTGKGRTRKREDVKLLQGLLGVSDADIDGKYGEETVRRVKAICGGDGKSVDGNSYLKIQENYLMSMLKVGGNGLTEDEANTIYARKAHSH
jgi:hypothetical protein